MKKLIVILAAATLWACSSGEKKQEEKATVMQQENQILLIGTYTKRESEGIYRYAFNPATGDTKFLSVTKGIAEPSFLTLSPNNKYVYAVSELDKGLVYAYALTDSATLQLIDTVSTEGAHPCHLQTDKTGKWLFVGNYTSGTLSVHRIKSNGGLEKKAVQTIQHTGFGPNKARQEGPHVHSVNVAPNNEAVIVADLGLDQLKVYRLDDSTGTLTLSQEVKLTAGSGPRHFVFHPNGKFAYVVQEMGSLVTAFTYSAGKLEQIQEIGTLPEGFEGENSCADIHLSNDGRFLYASNRFHDSIVIYSIDATTGKLGLVSHHAVLGRVPRNFCLSPDNNFVLVANQETDEVIVFRRDKVSGKISPAEKRIKLSMPVCLLFAGNVLGE